MMLLSLLSAAVMTSSRPVPVTVVRVKDRWEIRRGGKPYFVKGAGAHLPLLPQLRRAGANSVRTWGADDLRPMLDEAQRLGMTVLIGIWLNKTPEMNYDDPKMTSDQIEYARKRVREYRSHPAVLGYAVGNEMELGDTSERVFRQVERIAAMIRREDPQHLVASVVADMWPEKMALLRRLCPSLHLLGVNSYGGLPTLHERMKDWDRPYLVTEYQFSASGQGANTPWNSPIEPSGDGKARAMQELYQNAILKFPGRVLGGYLFHWSRADAATVGWFSTFLKTGEKLPVVDTAARIWGGKVGNRSPEVVAVRPPGPVRVRPGGSVTVEIEARDAEKDRLTYAYEVLSDDPAKRFVGDFEKATGTVAQGAGSPTFTFTAPRETGPYRVSIVIRDGKGGATSAAVSFFVGD